MSGEVKAPIAQRRLVTALCVVMALIAVVPLSGTLIGEVNAADAVAPLSSGIRGQKLAQAGGIDGVVNQLEDMARAEGETAVPSWFQREIGFLPETRDIRTDGISVVGFLVDDACDDVLATLIAHMETHGWTSIPLGEVDGATFVKQAGACTWAVATCTQTGSATSVVFRCNAA